MCSEPACARALQGLAGGVFLADGHQRGHLVLGDVQFLAAPVGLAHVGNGAGGALEFGDQVGFRHGCSTVMTVHEPQGLPGMTHAHRRLGATQSVETVEVGMVSSPVAAMEMADIDKGPGRPAGERRCKKMTSEPGPGWLALTVPDAARVATLLEESGF